MDQTVASMLSETWRVTLQLSNLCPWSERHPGCPASTFRERQVLSGRAVEDTLSVIGREKRGLMELAWHVYNEPTADPRLCRFMEMVRRALPSTCQVVWTNGWYLTPGLAEELVACGMGRLVVTDYYRDDRFKAIEEAVVRLGCGWHRSVRPHDGRFGWPSGPERPRVEWSFCAGPLADLTVRASGRIGLCCYDWREDASFESVVKLGFEEALRRSWPEMDRLRRGLQRRERELEVCRRCWRGRRRQIERAMR